MAVEPLALPPSTKAMVPRTDGNRAEILQKWLVWYYLVTKNETHLPTVAGFRNHPQYEQVSGSIGNPLIHIFSWSTPNMASYHKSPLPLILFDLLQGVIHITGFYQLFDHSQGFVQLQGTYPEFPRPIMFSRFKLQFRCIITWVYPIFRLSQIQFVPKRFLTCFWFPMKPHLKYLKWPVQRHRHPHFGAEIEGQVQIESHIGLSRNP
jgi:hypothetical protein